MAVQEALQSAAAIPMHGHLAPKTGELVNDKLEAGCLGSLFSTTVLLFLSSPDFPEISGFRWNLGGFGEIQEISGKLRGIHWNSVGFCIALSMNSVGIPGGFRGTPDFRENLGFGVVSGDLEGQKAFAQIAKSCPFFPYLCFLLLGHFYMGGTQMGGTFFSVASK